ncbi:hypothetical protein AXE80_07800 [Wenyingzhuangia fucanilytica]|uniref:DUF4382 domain-containing protein n=1 Tax=Wenyingzhuangia fucanilytica TaxID=1790137 RepID=A0A1B1Y5X9_9FLAO|nr:DUF4382 domain-containing protein [Wenyingzhuangia fucanilytica]ANW96186.1 hypothetical protein AXE80_07800 [Wenyingzhuangia fucanilytica]
MKMQTIKLSFRKMFFSVLSLTILGLMQSCSNSDGAGTAQVKFKLVDAPGNYEQVNVEIVDIQYNAGNDEGWKSLESFEGPLSVDLTTLVGGENKILADETVEANTMHQIRLVLGDNNTVVLKGETEAKPLSTPSAQQSGLKINLDEALEAGFFYTFVLDWDAQESIVAQGNGSYSLKPVIRVNAEKNSGIIQGKVLEDVDGQVEGDLSAIEGATVSLYDTMTQELVTKTETNAFGVFILQGISNGSYSLVISKEGFIEYTLETDIEVTVGETEELEAIKLQTAVEQQ